MEKSIATEGWKEVEEAVQEIEASVEDARADFPDVSDDDLHHEMMNSVLSTKTPWVQRQVRQSLGFDA